MKSVLKSVLLFLAGTAAASAAAIASGEVKAGTLKLAEKQTWTIALTAQQEILVGLGHTSSTNAGLFVAGTIIDPFGLPVGVLSTADADSSGRGGITPVYTGTYSIVVECIRQISDGLTASDTFTYRLEVLVPKAGSFSISNGDNGGALTNGLSSDGTILNGDLDPWTFTATAGEVYLLDLAPIPEPGAAPNPALPGSPPLAALLGVQLFYPNGTGGSSNTGRVTFTNQTGVHTIVIGNGFPYHGGPQRYRIRKITIPSVFQVSPGEQGGPLTNGVTHPGTVGYGHVDCWTIPASIGDTLTIRLNKTAGLTFVPRLTVYSPSEGRTLGGGDGELAITLRPTFNGIHTFVVESRAGFDTGSYNLFVSGATSPAPPTITIQPISQNVDEGGAISLRVTASGAAPLTYQWRRDGTAIAGALAATLNITNAQASHAGAYTVVVSNGIGSVTSEPAAVTVTPAPAMTKRISNVSVRTTLAASQTLIVGLNMSGGSKSVLLRAVGPGLGAFGVPGTMPDPRLALFNGAMQEIANDNWGGTAALSTAFTSVGAFALPAASLDAALLRNVDGARTAQVIGITGGGVLVEAYDAGTGNTPRLVNISARNQVGTGANILIAGFTIVDSTNPGPFTKTEPITVLIRAVGPTLAAFGVTGTLADPKLELYSGTTKINENDTWAATLAPTFASVGAFALTAGSRDAALVASLPAGSYTVQVSGADGGIGEALIEIYEVTP